MMEEKCYLLLQGYHSVAAASDILTRYHIGNMIVRTPMGMNNCCSFALMIDKSDLEMSATILDDLTVKIVCS